MLRVQRRQRWGDPKGVTGDTIKVAYRNTAEGNVLGLFAQLSGMPINESTEDLTRTAEGLIEYFNENYQLYGRKLEMTGYQGRGQLLQELFGGGQEGAANDALKASDEIGAFADVTALTQPYADALSRTGVVNFGAPYMSKEWFEDRRPYAWTSTPDCSAVSEMSTEYANEKLLNRPAVRGRRPAGPGALDRGHRPQQPRVPAVRGHRPAGHPGRRQRDRPRARVRARLRQRRPAGSVAAGQLKDNNITSVACYCDPLMVLSLASQATEQDYFPEWLIGGVGFVDIDLVGQFIAAAAPDQWRNAFGGSPSTPQAPAGTSEAYRPTSRSATTSPRCSSTWSTPRSCPW